MKKILLFRIFFFSVTFFSLITVSNASEDSKRLLSLVDYIGGDYKNAVVDGEIVDQYEYDEMLEFSAQAIEIQHALSKSTENDEDLWLFTN